MEDQEKEEYLKKLICVLFFQCFVNICYSLHIYVHSVQQSHINVAPIKSTICTLIILRNTLQHNLVYFKPIKAKQMLYEVVLLARGLSSIRSSVLTFYHGISHSNVLELRSLACLAELIGETLLLVYV